MEKIARLCWNTNEWRRPSGKEGKSKASKSYEKEKGFGHEEWLLDDSKIMPDGYHYGFLEPLNVKSNLHHGKVYDIHIFTISPEKHRVYLGCLKNAIGVSVEESKKVYNHYKMNGWLDEMRQDIIYAGGIVSDLKPSMMFNVKFKFEEAELHYSNQPLLKPESVWHRYNLMEKKGDLEFEKNKDGSVKMLDTSIFDRVLKGGKIQIDPLHKKIQNAVANLLKNQYTDLQLETSTNDSGKERVDIKGFSKSEKAWHFFEIKTVSAKRCIREAIGQILEYAHYPNEDRANKLFIVGPESADEQDKLYIQHLRKKYNIPVWFRWYSFTENKLYDGI
jgi:hypothetical protein